MRTKQNATSALPRLLTIVESGDAIRGERIKMSADPDASLGAFLSEAELWRRMHGLRPEMIRLAQRTLSETSDAEDAVSEAFVKIVRGGRTSPEQLRSHVVTAVRSVAIDMARKRNADRRRDNRYFAGEMSLVAPVDEDISDRSYAEAAQSKLAELPARERELLLLRQDGLSIREIAQRLGLTYRYAHKLLRQAQQHIIQIIGGMWLVVSVGLKKIHPKVVLSAAGAVAISACLLIAPFGQQNSPGISAPVGAPHAHVAAPTVKPKAVAHQVAHAVRFTARVKPAAAATPSNTRLIFKGPTLHSRLGTLGALSLDEEQTNMGFAQSLRWCLRHKLIGDAGGTIWIGCKP